ncbi:hypothetical protein ACUN8C_05740 [Kushneria sp. Sum13]|uniref:hypothetical protein n=1 Tax=Kushneria sp. Sum13 TaxID=3459196 RepID=UPI0040453EB7
MHVTTKPGADGTTHVTLRDEEGHFIDVTHMSPFVFELFLACCRSMTEAEAFFLILDEHQQEAA